MMNYLMLVNKNNMLDKDYIPHDLVDSKSKYKEGILVCKKVYKMFNLMKKDALLKGYNIDIMSGYRDYDYQVNIYNNLVRDKGLNYAFRYIAMGGCSEHQTGLAIDICVYRDNNCYIEHDIIYMEEINWVKENAHKYGFILRYPEDKEDITGYNYEGWHFRYVGNAASYIYFNNLTLEEYLEKICK